MFKSILVVWDATDAAQAAVARAALVAARQQARLTLLHVVPPAAPKPLQRLLKGVGGIDLRLERARTALARLAQHIAGRHDVHVTLALESGDAQSHVCARAPGHDLIVLGVPHRNALGECVLGIPIERLLRTCARAVLVVKTAVVQDYAQVLVPVDFTASSEVALQAALAIAPDAPVELFHALSERRAARMAAADVPPQVVQAHRQTARDRALVRLCSIVAAVSGGDGVRVTVAHGDAAQRCLQRQADLAADLVVIGQDGLSALGDFLLGSVTRQVVAHAASDVLVMPAPALGTGAQAESFLTGRWMAG